MPWAGKGLWKVVGGEASQVGMRLPNVLVSAGIETFFFLVAGIVLCIGAAIVLI